MKVALGGFNRLGLPPKGAHQQAYERFETVRLAADEALLKRFVFLLGAEGVAPAHRECHLYELLRASETVGRALTNQFYALYADIRRRVLTHLCRENATIAPPEILRCTQKLLDRVLFCALCEDRGLLPAESLKRAVEHRDPYNPHPLWLNFRGLFRAVDEGNAGLNIWFSNARLEELRGQRTLFDLDRQILQNNLYGVGLNEEVICRHGDLSSSAGSAMFTPSLSFSSSVAICDGSCGPFFCYSLINPSFSASVRKNRRFSHWIQV